MRCRSLILPFPLPLLVLFSTEAVWPQRTITGREVTWCSTHHEAGMWRLFLNIGLLYGKTTLDWKMWLRPRNLSKASYSILLESGMLVTYQQEPARKPGIENITMKIHHLSRQWSCPLVIGFPVGEALTIQIFSFCSNRWTSTRGYRETGQSFSFLEML